MTASIEAQLKALDEKAHNANHVNQDPVIIQDHTVQRQQEANQYYATLFGIAVLGLSVVALVTAGFVRWVLLWHLRPIMAAYNKAATAQETNVPPTPPRYGGGPTWTKPNRPDCKQRPERYKVDIK